jgi:hypothetical protein
MHDQGIQQRIIERAIPEYLRKSQGSRPVQCARCSADIPPYAGVRVARYADRFIHQPGQCATAEAELARLHEVAGQAGFAWSCTIATPGAATPAICGQPVVCSEQGTDPAEFAAHMAAHNPERLQPLPFPVPARLRGRPRLRSWPKSPAPSIFKALHWQDASGARHKGQYWSDSDDAHGVWAIDYATGRPVRLYVNPDGSATASWSESRRVRREHNRSLKRAAA